MRPAFLFLAFANLVFPVYAQPSPGSPLSGLELLKDFESQRASSSDPDWRNGNADARPIPSGGTLVVANLKGPGIITHIWNTIAHEAPFYSRLLTLKIYWDGEDHPSVEAPIGDFFGIGHGIDKPFVSLPIKVSSEGRGRNCYWPMPFRESAKILVVNESDKPCSAFYFYVDWQKHKSLPKDTAYFHAMYRQEFPCVMGRNYLLADIVGRGHYVGTIQSVQLISPGWYGEGDDFFFIDDEKEPRLRGTGTEDYFCDGWGFRVQDGPFYGTPLWEGVRNRQPRHGLSLPLGRSGDLQEIVARRDRAQRLAAFPGRHRKWFYRARRSDVERGILVSDRTPQTLAHVAARIPAVIRANYQTRHRLAGCFQREALATPDRIAETRLHQGKPGAVV
jgi:hypothetical protein